MLSAACSQLDKGSVQASETFRLAAKFRATFAGVPCRLYFVGVWDTVKSIGWIENPLSLPYSSDNPDIEFGRHAIAIDERRAFFRTNLWRPKVAKKISGPKDWKQVWFPGVHSDVGGGYAEAESGLSKIALKWMMGEASNAGLLLNTARVQEILGGGPPYAPPSPTAVMHESLTWKWWLAEFVWKKHWNWDTGKWERRMNLFRRRTIPPNSLVHESAYMRGDEYGRLIPATSIRTA